MSGPRISIVPADAEKTISLNPNVGINDIKVSQKQRPQQRRQPVKRKEYIEDSDDESIKFGKSKRNNEFPNANQYEDSDDLSDVSSVKQKDANDPFLSNISNPMKTRYVDQDDEDEEEGYNNHDYNQNTNEVNSERNEDEQVEYENQKSFYEDDKKELWKKNKNYFTNFIGWNKKEFEVQEVTMDSDLESMKIEYSKLTRQIEVEQSIKFQRRALMAIVSGMEFLNKRYDPFDVKLDGWSESVMEGVEDYDSIFERLHEKYKSKSEMAPEIELMLSLAGSAFMFHLTKTLFKSAMPNMADIAKQNPELMQNVAQAMMQNMASQRKGPSEPMKEGPPPDHLGPPTPVNPRREMKGPSIQPPGLGALGGMGGGGLGDMMQQLGPLGGMMQDMLGNLGGPPQMNNYQNGPPMPAMARESQFEETRSEDMYSEMTSVSSIDFGNPSKTKDILISENGKKKRGRRGKNEVTLNI